MVVVGTGDREREGAEEGVGGEEGLWSSPINRPPLQEEEKTSELETEMRCAYFTSYILERL